MPDLSGEQATPITSPAAARGEPRRSGRHLYPIALVFIAMTVAAALLSIWLLRRDRIADEMEDTKNLGVVLAAQTTRSFQAIDLVLQQVQAMVDAAGPADPDQFRQLMASEKVHQFLLDRVHSLPQADAISLIDETGRIVNFSRAWPIPHINTSDRDFYAYWRDHPGATSFVGAPVINKVTGAWVLTITRRINGPHGEFLGIVLGVVDLRYFEDFYQAIRTNAGESVALFRLDGTLLARYPRIEAKIGTKLPHESAWYATIGEGGGTYRTPGYVGGEPRIISAQLANDYPLAITVGISEQVALATWRIQSVIIAIGAACAAAGFFILFRGLAVQFRRIEQNEARFRGFAVTSSDWFWETDEHHRFSYISEGVSAFGFGVQSSSFIGRTRLEIAVRKGASWAIGEPAAISLKRC